MWKLTLGYNKKKQQGVHKFLKGKNMDYHTVKQLIFGYLGHSTPHF